jgi:rubrerythrin
MDFLQTKTYENLKKAFISECSARTRYEFVEYGQRMQGLEGLATITDKIAYQEFNHARMLYTMLCEKVKDNPLNNVAVRFDVPFRQRWDILDNLAFTAKDEEEEAKFYQKASKVALSEGFKDVSELFENIRKVEVKHKKIFEYLYDGYKNGTLYKSDNKKHYVCPSCGHEMFGTKPEEVCPLCQAKIDTFTILLPPSLAF